MIPTPEQNRARVAASVAGLDAYAKVAAGITATYDALVEQVRALPPEGRATLEPIAAAAERADRQTALLLASLRRFCRAIRSEAKRSRRVG